MVNDWLIDDFVANTWLSWRSLAATADGEYRESWQPVAVTGRHLSTGRGEPTDEMRQILRQGRRTADGLQGEPLILKANRLSSGQTVANRHIAMSAAGAIDRIEAGRATRQYR